MNGEEREIRAARNESAFRAINERIRELNEAFGAVSDVFAIACECADQRCLDVLELAPHEYEAIRRHPRRFAVLAGHVAGDVETVVSDHGAWVVVEKTDAAGEFAERFSERE